MNIIYFACKDSAEAEKIAQDVIEKKLAFCTNILSECFSIYRWKGKTEKSKEAVVIMKTLPHLVKKAIAAIKKLHSYQMPEIISWTIDEVDSDILNWASDELK